MKDFIYALSDSRKPSVIAYVGRTRDITQRYKKHRAQIERATEEWVGEVLRLGGELRMIVLEMVPTAGASAREMQWVITLRPFLNGTGHRYQLMPKLPRSPDDSEVDNSALAT